MPTPISFPMDGNQKTIANAMRKYAAVTVITSAVVTNFNVAVPVNAYSIMILNQHADSEMNINGNGFIPMGAISEFGIFVNGIDTVAINSPINAKNLVLVFIS